MKTPKRTNDLSRKLSRRIVHLLASDSSIVQKNQYVTEETNDVVL
jgi:hypothetical protein